MLIKSGRILSIMMIILMIFPFSLLAYAEEPAPEIEESVTAQEEAGAVCAEQAASDASEPEESPAGSVPETPELQEQSEAADAVSVMPEPDTSSQPDVPVTENTETLSADATAETDAADTVFTDTENEPETAGTRAVQAKAGGAAADKNITIAGNKLDCSADMSGSGWQYEKESGRVVLRDYTGCADITSDGTGVDIVSTGFNRIGTLSCDGDINVIGSGILLIDKLELAEGCSFNLLPLREYYGDDGGSAAVFLLQEDGSYKLINKKITGIIDETIELSDDIRLVLPAETSLELRALKFIVEKDEAGNETIITDFSGYSEEELENAEFNYYGGHLVLTSLTVDAEASIKSNEIKDQVVPSIIVAGSLVEGGAVGCLVNNGIISGGAVTVRGKYSGTGIFEKADVTLRDCEVKDINLRDSILSLEWKDYTLDHLGVSGSSELYYDSNLEIKNVSSSDTGSLIIESMHSPGDSHVLNLSGPVDKCGVTIKSGVTELGTNMQLINSGSVNNSGYGGPVFNYSGLDLKMNGTDGSVFLGPGNIVVPEPDAIPAVSFTLRETLDWRNNIILEENPETGDKYKELDDYDVAEHSTDNRITYESLLGTYFPQGSVLPEGAEDILFEVFSCDGNKVSMTVLGEDTDLYKDSTSADGVFLIRMAYHYSLKNSHGGSAATSTHADQTGAGDIGGNSTAVFRGTGITRNSHPDDPDPIDPDKPDPIDPDKPDPIDPDKPDPIDPDKPDPIDPDRPDPVDPSQPVTLYTSAVSSIRLRVGMYDPGDRAEHAIPVYILSADRNGFAVEEFGRKEKVVMDYELPEGFSGKSLYAVFANRDEQSEVPVKAYRAEYDESNGKLSFETMQTGAFVITALDFEGEEFSPEFYDEIGKTEEVQTLIRVLEEEEQNAGI